MLLDQSRMTAILLLALLSCSVAVFLTNKSIYWNNRILRLENMGWLEEDLQGVLEKREKKLAEEKERSSLISSLKKERGRDLTAAVFRGHAHVDVKLHAVYARLYVGLRYADIGEAYGKSTSTIFDWVKEYLNSGGFQSKPRNHSRKIYVEHREWVLRFVHHHPLSYLCEIL